MEDTSPHQAAQMPQGADQSLEEPIHGAKQNYLVQLCVYGFHYSIESYQTNISECEALSVMQ